MWKKVKDPVEERRHAMMAAMAQRLARVRGNMTDAEFGQLIADMVRVAERFAAIEGEPGALRPATPQTRS